MTLKNVFTLNAVLAILVGLIFYLIPNQAIEFYNGEFGDVGAGMARLFGAASIGFGVMTWFAREAGPSLARRGMVYGLFAGFALGFVSSLIAQLNGVLNNLGWLTVIIYFLFAVDYAYFGFVRKEG